MARVFMKGTEAIAEAAVRSGCRFFAGYPITPQNEIPEYFARRMPEVGGVFVQGESEVASVNMVYGAVRAGVAFVSLFAFQSGQLRGREVRIGERVSFVPLVAFITLLALFAFVALCTGSTGCTLRTGIALVTLRAFQSTHIDPRALIHIPLIHHVSFGRPHKPRFTGLTDRMGVLQSRKGRIQPLHRVI